jgi:hypothetical protein
MSIFDSKINKNVAEAVMKVLEADQKEKMAKKDYDQDGKIETGKAEVLGSRIRAARLAGKLKEETKPEMLKESKQLQEYESKGGVFKHKAKLTMGAKYGESDYSKGGEEDTESKKDLDYQKTSKKTGARQNNFNRGKTTGYTSKAKTVKEDTEMKLSFTEMLQLYNEAGLEVIAKIVPEKVNFGDIEVEVFDADKINGTIETDIVEEVDNETFTKEVEAQKAKNAGGGKKAQVAKASVQAVEVQKEEAELEEGSSWSNDSLTLRGLSAPGAPMSNRHGYKKAGTGTYLGGNKPRKATVAKATSALKADIKDSLGKHPKPNLPEEVEQIDEISSDLAGKYLTAPQGKGANKYKTGEGTSSYPNADTMSKHGKSVSRAVQRAGTGMSKKPSYYKEEEQMDERHLTADETKEKEMNVKGMKKSLSGFKARYGDDAKSVMYATATKMAKKD